MADQFTQGTPEPMLAPDRPERDQVPDAERENKQPNRLRVAIPLLVIGGFLAFVLWAVRDNQSADDLGAGTCFDIPTSIEVQTVTKHACTEPHDAEVFHNAEFTDGSSTYPISMTFDGFVDDVCVPAFEAYVGEHFDKNEELTIGYFFPTRDGWDGGDRTVTCYVSRVDESKLSQSVQNAAS